MKRTTIALSLLTAAVTAIGVACSSSSNKSSSSSTDAGGDAGSGFETSTADVNYADILIVDNNNCVAPGTPNNAEGIGGYCSPGAGQCAMAGPGGTPTLCSADYGAPAHDWFCTYPCSGPSTCGSGSLCVSTATGASCVPASCLAEEGDAGYTILDGGEGGSPAAEAGADAPADSPAGDSAGD